jgi:kynurenine formamidase
VALRAGDYLLACLPLRLEGGEAALARVVLIDGIAGLARST